MTKTRSSLQRRLRPLHVAIAFQGTMLWVPVEKLFMNEIGFDAASVGVMAAAYAAVVPIIEVSSGILADRWSRRGVLMVASAALMVCALIGGLSNDVFTYVLSALVLGVYIAMYSGTMDAIVYDTVLEETGDSDGFETRIGRVRLVESIVLVASALLGGWLAGLTSPRLMYFLTVPFAAISVIAYLKFREPQLHKATEATSLRSHLALTFRTLTRRGHLLPIIALAVLTSLVLQVIVEFGPLWLVALAVPAALYGPYWAGLMSTFGLGGLLAGRLRFDRPATLVAVTGVMILAALALTMRTGVIVVMIAQVVLALLLVMASIHATHRLHDAVPSTIRSGVASGAGALSWIAFLPFALVLGVVSKNSGMQAAGWMIVPTTVLAGALLVIVAVKARRAAATAPELAPSGKGHAWNLHGSDDLVSGIHCVEFVELVSAFLDGSLDPISERRLVDHIPTCQGCAAYLHQFGATVHTLGNLPPNTLPDDARETLVAAFRTSGPGA